MKLLEGKNILITGASRGIGNGIAVTLASHGANIFFTYVNSKDNATALEKKFKDLVLRLNLISQMHLVLTNLIN